ncbi:MAG: EAL domain-containing protein [Sulfuritalea sp.]|nr:EAL domain-containing protein [Sulfuritalea sp.]
MKAVRSPPAGAANDEISALIATLHATGQRLEELTAGEVDGVTDSEGRTFLLRHVQEKLRHSEAAKQAAILNALPAHIALLDAQGIIISVNDAWRQFAATNALQGPQFGIGVDYLALCDSASGDGATEARQAAAGIRAVLAPGRGAKSFSLEYPCHSPTQQRWFLMTATPFADDPPVGVVVMHSDVTERKRGEEALRRFVSALDTIADGIFLTDRTTMSYIHVNQAACQQTNQTRDELLAMGPMRLLGKSRAEVEGDFDAIIDSGVDAEPFELLWHRADGAPLWVELRRHAQWSGGRWTIVTMVRDITARKQAENRIRRLNRVYAVLSGINALIVRVADRDALFREACRIAVEDGGFRMAWIGLVDQAAMELVPVAAAGTTMDAATLVNQRFSLAEETPHGNTLSAMAIRDRVPVFTNDVPNDPRVVFKAEHAQRGSRSMAILPLLVSGDTVGVLALYAEEAGFFDEEELKLLTELAGDIGFAIDHLAKGARLNYLAYYDPLTGLANRSLFLERVAQHLRNAVAGGHKLAMFLIDLERFKSINDSLGRPAGDALLRLVAEWLTSHVEDASLLARVGADHFAVVLPEVKMDCDVARQLETTIEALVEHPFRLNDAVFRVAAKVGVALYPEDGTDADALFRNAEAALKRAKASGERYLFYTQTMTATAAASLSLENLLRQALDNHEFVLHYQPKVNLVSGKLVGAEALIRWNDPRTGLVPPIRFIPVLEEIGLIHDVGRWALRQAIADYLRWRAAGFAAVRIAVNVSPLQLRQRGFIAEVEQAIGVDAQAAAGLELEITESVIMEDIRHNIASLQAIRAMGVSIAIDDFGTGFSSLSYLSRLPIDTLKIDRSFVIDMTAGPEGLALVSTIIDLAHALKLKVVAEGVETEEQRRLLLLLNCDEMQGYYVSKPLPVDVFEARYLAASSATPA